MDMKVRPVGAEGRWQLTDLLGRTMGTIVELDSEFAIAPEGHAVETMKGMKHRPFPSLNAALSAIETHTRGTCRLDAIPVEELNASNDE